MTAPYNDVQHALSRAFSAPIARYKSSSIWSTGVKGFGEMTAMEKVALDGIVQTIAIATCHPSSIHAFRVIWEGDIELALEAMQALADGVVWPSRKNRPPDEMCAGIIQKWARRRILRVPVKSDRAWSKVIGCDHKTVGRARVALQNHLKLSYARGIRVMDAELRCRGLVPDIDEADKFA